jgi:AcrR family transcriptional regulator
MSKGDTTKQRIIDAAEEVVLRDGVGRLTLEATAVEAGLSKGGVLYHFASRDALVAGMVQRIIEEFDRDLAEKLGRSTRPGAFTDAYIRSTLEPGRGHPGREDRLGAALIAAAAAQPELMVPLQRAFDGWQARLEDDGIDPVRATVLRLAADGLWLSELFGLAVPTPSQRATLGAELERMVAGP